MNAEDRELLPRMLEGLYRERAAVTRLDAILAAEALDLPEDLLGIVNLLPPGDYYRQRMCDQLNSALKGHGWMTRFGAVD